MVERKLIAHGPSSLTVSLPYRWLNKYGLKKGDRVKMDETEKGLLISAGPTISDKETAISLFDLEYHEIIAIMTTLYRRGYDKVTLKYNDNLQYEAVAQAIRNLLGFAILDTRKRKIIIQTLSIEKDQDFSMIFKRIFFILIQEFEDIKQAIINEESIEGFYLRDKDINTLVNLGLRIISKGHINDRFLELHMFHSLLMLEEIGDDLIKLSIELQTDKYNKKIIIRSLEEVMKMIRILYDSNFKGDNSLQKFYEKYYLYFPDQMPKKRPEILDFFKDEAKGQPTFYLRSICEKIVSVAEILLLPEAKKI